jgi:hypothetical protein
MKYYLSGPMTGIPDYNFPAFKKVREDLTERGLKVVSAEEMGQELGFDWYDYLRRDLAIMVQECDKIVLLPGWWKSKGAMLELTVAACLNFDIYLWADVDLVYVDAKILNIRHLTKGLYE